MATSVEELTVIDRSTGGSSELPFGDISLTGNSVVKIPASHTSVTFSQRLGDDLVLKFTDGSTLNVRNFFASNDNQVVFEDGGSLWQGQYDGGLNALQFTELQSLDALMLVPAASAGVSWLAIGLGAAGVAALAAGGGSSGADDNSVNPPPVSLQPLSDLAVNATGTTLIGRGQPGFTVTVRNTAGEVITTDTVAADGSFSVPLSPAQTDGALLNVTQSNSAGNESASLTVATPDLTAPEAATNLQVGSDGSVLSGEGEPGAVVTVRNAAGDVIGTGTVAQDGQFSITLSPAQIDGSTLSVALTDSAGNVSQASMVSSPDNTPPVAASDLQVSSNGSVISGRGDPSSVVTVRNQAGDIVGIGMVNIDGSFSINLSPAQADGAALSITLTDAAGNMSSVGTVNTPDLTPPPAPSSLEVSNDGTVLTGRGEAGATVTVRDATEQVVGSGIVAADGSFSVVLSPPQVEGAPLNVVLTGSNGNTSESSAVQSPDLVTLQMPTNVTVQANGTMVQGLAQPAGAEVMVHNADNQMVGWGMVNPDGSFTVMLNPPQNDGRVLRLSLRMGDQYSSPVWSDTPDITPPAAPDNLQLSADGLTVNGSGAAGSTVTIRDSAGVLVGTGTISASGLFSINLLSAQIDGSALQITLTDAAGNQSAAAAVSSPDLTAPNVPVSLQIINSGQKLIGSGEPGSVVRVLSANNEVLGIGAVLPDGSFNISLIPAQMDGAALQVTLTDAAGNTSVAGNVSSPDLTPPAAPQSVQLNAQGTALSGTGEVGATVKVLNAAGLLVGSGIVQADGSFSITLNPPQIDGGQLSVVLTDNAGNTSAAATLQSPDLVEIAAPVELSVSPDGTTLNGEGTAGTQVQVWNAAGEQVGSGTVQGDGSFSIALTPVQQDGGALQVILTDGAGKYSAPGLVSTFDNTAPDIPVNLQVSADGSSVSGSGEAGAMVTVRDAANQIVGTGTVQANGSFSATLTPAQTDGAALSVTLTDAAGNTSLVATVNTPDLQAPAMPDNLGVSADGLTLSGTGEPGAVVTVRNMANQILGTGTVQADGSFDITLSVAQTDGSLLSVTLTDVAGNTSIAGSVNSIDLVAPAIPQNLQIMADGTQVSGDGEVGATVTIRDNTNAVVGSGVVEADGSFTITLMPAQQDGGLLSIVLTDSANNSSDAGWLSSPDLIAPDMPLNLNINAAGTLVSGQGELGALVKIYNAAGDLVGSGLVGPDGTFTVTLFPVQGDSGVLSVTLTDAAENESAAGLLNAPDLIPPAAPVNVVINVDGSSLTGSGEVDAVVTVRNAANQIVGTGTVQGDGSFSITLNPLQNDGGQLSITLTDSAGNVSAAGQLASPDLLAPDMPLALHVSTDGSSLTGSGEAGTVVTVRNAANQIVGTGTVQADGSFTILLSPVQGDSGVLNVTLTDAAGNISVAGNVSAPDLIVPDIPVNLQISADGVTVTGEGEAGAIVRIYNSDDLQIGSGLVQPDGSFSITLNLLQNDGSPVQVTLTDAAGNISAAAIIASPDLTAPDAPLNLQLNADGSTLTGTGEPGADVSVRNVLNAVVGTGTVLPDGSFSISLVPVQNNGGSLNVALTDSAGNTSGSSTVNAPDLIAPDMPTNLQVSANGSILSGTGEAGTTITVHNAANQIVGSGTVQPDGSFTLSLFPAQGDGGLLSITLADAAGNTSVAGTIASPDLIAPDLPLNLLVNASGTLLSGTGEAGTEVTVRNAVNQIVGTGTVQVDGSFSVTLTPAQTDGSSLSVTLTDTAGNTSVAGDIASPDLIAPDAPFNLQVNATGTLLSGSGEAGTSVTVRNALNEVIGTGTVLANGSFSIVFTVPQGDSGLLSITLTDAAGNTSLAGTVSAPDLIPPAMPLALQVNAEGTSISGTGEAGTVVTVRNATNHIVGSGVVQGDGSFSIALNPPQVDGGELRITLTDAAGNASDAGFAMSPDLIEIAAPVNLGMDGAGTELTGEGEAGSIVTVWNEDGQQVGSGGVLPNGTFSITLVPAQIDGRSLEVVLSDGAGKYSAPGLIISPDLTAPDMAAALQVNADGSLLTGTGEAGATVEVHNAANQLLGTGTVQPDGSFSVTLAPPQQDGTALQLTLTDAAGNTSVVANVSTPDLIAPAAPANLQVSADGLSLTGNGEAGSTVTVSNAANQIIGTATVQGDGSFTVALGPAQNDGSLLQVSLTDTAGNISDTGLVLSPDLVAPSAPANLQVSADGLSLSGNGEAGATVTVRNAVNQIVGTGLVQPDGSFIITLLAVQGDSGVLGVTLTDAAGNSSDAASANAPDLIPPAVADNLSINAPGTELTGEGEPGATVTIYNADADVVGTGIVAVNGVFTIALNPAQDSGGLLSVVLADSSGNISAAAQLAAPVVVDIAAFDNAATAKVNILPTETQSSAGSAAYTLLLGLLGAINLQLLATPSIGFTVADGSEGQITLTLDTLLAIDALGEHRIVLQVKQDGQWQAISGVGQASFLSVSLLADNAKGVVVEGLAAGEYRAFVAINALVGLSIATTLSGALIQADYSNPHGYDDIAASGNVLADLNDESQQDLLTVNTVVSQVNQTVVAAVGNTVIQGQYGQLTIDAAGNYTYTPDANATVIGKAEQFQYRIIDTATGRQSTATLYVRIDSDQVDLVWGEPGNNAELVLSAGNNSAVAAVVYKNVVDAPVTNLLGTFNTPGAILVNPGKGSGQFAFQVDANDVSNIIIYAGTSLAVAVLPTFSVVLEKSNGAGGWVAVPGGSVSGTALLGLPLVGTGVSLSLDGLTGGNYRITVNTNNTIGGSFLSSVQLVQTITHLDEYTVDTNPGVSGNILANDVLGSSFTKLFVKGSSGLYQEVNYAGISITGSYGVLHINKHGDYVYTPNGSQHHTADVTELFEYQLRHPGGEIITARLEIQLDVAGAGVLSGNAVLQSDGEDAVDTHADNPQVYEQPGLSHEGWSPDFDLLTAKMQYTAELATGLDLHLSQLLDTGQHIQLRSTEASRVALTADNWQVTTDMHNLRLLAEQEYYQQNNMSVV